MTNDDVQDIHAEYLKLRSWIAQQIAWSEANIGAGRRTDGLIAHVKDELAEVKLDPADPMEWVDVAILGFDGAWRSMAYDALSRRNNRSAEDIAAAVTSLIASKQRINMARTWQKDLPEDQPTMHQQQCGAVAQTSDGSSARFRCRLLAGHDGMHVVRPIEDEVL